MANNLFLVYGTLKAGFGNHRLLAKSEFVAKVTTKPDFTMVSLGGFPGVIEGGDTPILGELYKVPPECHVNLDRLEGYPDFYGKTEVETEHGSATMYVLDEKYLSYNHVENGEWL